MKNARIGAPEIKNTKYATTTQYRVFLYYFFFPCTKCATSTQNGVFRSTKNASFQLSGVGLKEGEREREGAAASILTVAMELEERRILKNFHNFLGHRFVKNDSKLMVVV